MKSRYCSKSKKKTHFMSTLSQNYPLKAQMCLHSRSKQIIGSKNLTFYIHKSLEHFNQPPRMI